MGTIHMGTIHMGVYVILRRFAICGPNTDEDIWTKSIIDVSFISEINFVLSPICFQYIKTNILRMMQLSLKVTMHTCFFA